MITESVLNRLTEDTKALFDIYDKMGLTKTKKQRSEDISGLFENAIEANVKGSYAPKVDSEPDIYLECGKAVELKTSSTTGWRGGSFSKRSGHFIFINWEIDECNNPKFFIAGIDLEESDWSSSTSATYYATLYGKKELYENREDVTFYVGSITPKHGKKSTTLKVNLETNINTKSCISKKRYTIKQPKFLF